jgi:hypothetical protein
MSFTGPSQLVRASCDCCLTVYRITTPVALARGDATRLTTAGMTGRGEAVPGNSSESGISTLLSMLDH